MVHNDATLVAAVETFLGVDDDFRASAPDAKTREEAVGITAEKYAMPEADVERVVNMMLGSDIRWLRLRWMTRYPHYEDLNRQLACGAPTAFAEVWDHIPMLTEADREAARACYDAL